MTPTAAPRYKFMLYAPDYTDPEAANRRLAVREKHIANVHLLIEEGFLVKGAPILSPESILTPDSPQKMIGSLMIFEAESLEACTKRIQEDIYYTSGVWDKENMKILPVMWQ